MARSMRLLLAPAFLLVACGGQPAIAPLPSGQFPAPEPQAQQADSNPGESPQPSGDTSVGSPGRPASVGGPPCEAEIALRCLEGLVDGCLSGATSRHVCMLREASSVPCTQEVARVCAPGFVDACLVSPPVSAFHVCVQSGS